MGSLELGGGGLGAGAGGGMQPQRVHRSRINAQAYEPSVETLPVVQANGYMGRRKALLIGINYVGSRNQLNGCVNDVRNVQTYLQQYGYQEIRVMTDEQQNQNGPDWPSKANILQAFQWLTQGVQSGDHLVWHYSGHGCQSEDAGTDDDCICPVDFRDVGQILDLDLRRALADPIPPGARLLAVMDCCHSGTGMDLPYNFKEQPLKVGTKHERQQTAGDVFLFAGCRDSQTSADTTAFGAASGAMTSAFLEALKQNGHQVVFAQLLQSIQQILSQKRMSQVPQLSYGRPVDLNRAPFML